MATFVMMHGGGMGGWIWKFIAPVLRAEGHVVYTPTFTGFGERIHLLSRDITHDTHVADVANVLKFEDLTDVILVGHSYAGTVIPGVVAADPSRVRRAVYVDAIVPKAGETVGEAMDYMTAEVAAGTLQALKAGQAPVGTGVDKMQREMAKDHPMLMSADRQQWLLDHLSDMPLGGMASPVSVGAEQLKIPVDYIAVTETVMRPKHHDRARGLGWNLQTFEGDHCILVGDPDKVLGVIRAAI